MASSLRASAPPFVSNSASLSAPKAVMAEKPVSKMKELPVESALFSIDFLNLIKASNREKSEKTPLITILQAQFDPELVLVNLATQYDYHTLAKTHRIAIKIQSNGDIETPLKQIAKEFKLTDVLILDGHGSPTEIFFGDENNKNPHYTLSHVASEAYQYLEKGASLFLTGCETGQQLAPKIAAASKKPTTAPLVPASAYRSYFHQCPKHGLELVCYNERGRQVDLRFDSGTKKPSCANNEVYNDKLRFLYGEAMKGNSSAFDFLISWNRRELKLSLAGIAEIYSKYAVENKTWRPFYIYLCYLVAEENLEDHPSIALHWVFKCLDECNKALKSGLLTKPVAEEITSTREDVLYLSKMISNTASDTPA